MREILNNICRNLFITDWSVNNKLSIVIDNNKHHINMKLASDNLKNTRHVRDNRQGLICHAAASTSNNFIIGTEYECSNDTACSATIRLVINIFSPSRACANSNHTHVSINRGYWIFKIIIYLLEAGAVT